MRPTVSKNPIRLAAILIMATAHPAAAHISLESTDSLWIRPTGIDVRIYMSRGSADAVIAAPGETVTIVRDNFPAFQPRLAAAGPGLLLLTTADGKTLMADAASAALTDDDDICYQLHYPLPRTLPGELTLHARYLDKMDEGHVGDIHILNATDDQLALGEVRAETPDFAFKIPAVAATAPPAPATDASPAPTIPKLDPGTSWGPWGFLGGVILVVVILGLLNRGGRARKK